VSQPGRVALVEFVVSNRARMAGGVRRSMPALLADREASGWPASPLPFSAGSPGPEGPPEGRPGGTGVPDRAGRGRNGPALQGPGWL
jgi:hypothetical protein